MEMTLFIFDAVVYSIYIIVMLLLVKFLWIITNLSKEDDVEVRIKKYMYGKYQNGSNKY